MSNILHEKLAALAVSADASFSGALQGAAAAVIGNANRSANSAAISLAQFEARETMMTAGSAMSWMDGPGLATMAKATRCPTGALFDGTNDYMTRGAELTGLIDGTQGTVAFLVNFTGGDGVRQRIFSNGNVVIDKSTSNRLGTFVQNNGGTISLAFSASAAGAITASSGWTHCVMSWDTNFSAGNKLCHLYINGIERRGTPTDAGAAFTIDYTIANWGVGGRHTDGADKLTGDLAELWFHPTYIDLSVAANLRKFITPSGYRADLLSDGSGPTGSQPILYLRGPASAMATNLGSGGDFSVTGALTDSSTNPTCGA